MDWPWRTLKNKLPSGSARQAIPGSNRTGITLDAELKFKSAFSPRFRKRCAGHFFSSMKRPSHLPLSHRLMRVYVVCQFPNSDGRSRQGVPVRATHRTAAKNHRLSAAVTPLSLALPGCIASILAHFLSLRSAPVIALILGFAPQIKAKCLLARPSDAHYCDREKLLNTGWRSEYRSITR